jgi:hypothetical protein
MAESHVVSALVSKRAEIAGLITRTEQQLGQFRADLVHLDAALRLFAPELEPKTIPAKRIRQADLWFEHGELPKRVLDALRRAQEPIRARCRAGRNDRQGSRPCRSRKLRSGSVESQRHSEEPPPNAGCLFRTALVMASSGGSPITRLDVTPPFADDAANIQPNDVTVDGREQSGHMR